MSLHKTFTVSHESWEWDAFLGDDYALDGVNAEVVIHVREDDDSLLGEFAFRWHHLVTGPTFGGIAEATFIDSPRLEIFDDAWVAFLGCPELLGWLGANSGKQPTPEALVEFLNSKGYTDITAHDNKALTVD